MMNSKDLPMVFLTSGGVNSVCLSIVIIDIGFCYPLVFLAATFVTTKKNQVVEMDGEIPEVTKLPEITSICTYTFENNGQ